MKIIRIFISLLMVIMLANTAVFADDSVSAWAADEVAEAVELEIVPITLDEDYTSDITRLEFADVGLHFLALQYNISINDLMDYYQFDNPRRYDENYALIDFFDDTDEVLADIAYLAGIVKGRGDGIFDPDSAITREEAAQMLYNAYLIYAVEPVEADISVLEKFADRGSVSSWAEEAVAFVVKYDVMNGTSETEFSPKSHYTREQCYTTFLRMYKNAPCSRLYGTAKNLWTYEEMVEEISTRYLYRVLYKCETDDCMIIFGEFQTGLHGGSQSFWIVYKDGGRKEIDSQFSHTNNVILRELKLGAGGDVFYCTQYGCNEHYKIDLANATVEVISDEEYEKVDFMPEEDYADRVYIAQDKVCLY